MEFFLFPSRPLLSSYIEIKKLKIHDSRFNEIIDNQTIGLKCICVNLRFPNFLISQFPNFLFITLRQKTR
jgi:hypothetical protein